MTFYLFKVYTLFPLLPPEVNFRHPHNGHINPLASNPGACYWTMAYNKHCISTRKTVPKDSLTHLTGLLRHHPGFEDLPRHLTFFQVRLQLSNKWNIISFKQSDGPGEQAPQTAVNHYRPLSRSEEAVGEGAQQ